MRKDSRKRRRRTTKPYVMRWRLKRDQRNRDKVLLPENDSFDDEDSDEGFDDE